jgi:hypothetical protein
MVIEVDDRRRVNSLIDGSRHGIAKSSEFVAWSCLGRKETSIK